MPPEARLALAWISVALGAAAAPALAQDRNWSIAPVVGLHHPQVDGLDQDEFTASFGGTADVIDELGFNTPTRFDFSNPLEELDPGALAGLEFQWRLSDRHYLLIGYGSWESTSQASVQGRFPVQGSMERVVNARKAKLSYNELSVGWRFDAVRRAKYKLYTRLSMHDLFDVDHREDNSFLFLSGPPQSFRKSLILQSQATGVLVFQAGVGGEWFLRDWLSLGFESSYGFTYRSYNLRDATLVTDFRDTDNLFLEVPSRPDPGGSRSMTFRQDDGSYKVMKLSFDGWKALFRVNFYY